MKLLATALLGFAALNGLDARSGPPKTGSPPPAVVMPSAPPPAISKGGKPGKGGNKSTPPPAPLPVPANLPVEIGAYMDASCQTYLAKFTVLFSTSMIPPKTCQTVNVNFNPNLASTAAVRNATYFVRKGLGFSDGSSTLYVTSAVVMDPAIHFQSGPSCAAASNGHMIDLEVHADECHPIYPDEGGNNSNGNNNGGQNNGGSMPPGPPGPMMDGKHNGTMAMPPGPMMNVNHDGPKPPSPPGPMGGNQSGPMPPTPPGPKQNPVIYVKATYVTPAKK